MNQSISRWLASSAAMIAVLLAGGAVQAQASYSKKTTIADAGKWAKAWSNVNTMNCAYGPALPVCNTVRASVTGHVLNAQIEAVSGNAYVRRFNNHGPYVWEWGYSASLFGKSITSRSGQQMEANVLNNQLIGQPFITHNAPFKAEDTLSVTVDTGEISGLLGFFIGDETFKVHYSVSGGVSAQVDVMPLTIYGPLATAVVQPRAEMVVAGGKSYSTIGASGYVGTEGKWINVLAPGSNIRFDAAVVGATGRAKVTMLPNIRALKGHIIWKVEGAFVNDDSGYFLNQPNYFLTLQPSTPSTLFEGILTPSI